MTRRGRRMAHSALWAALAALAGRTCAAWASDVCPAVSMLHSPWTDDAIVTSSTIAEPLHADRHLLAASSTLARFRAVPGKGLRGFLDGGEFGATSADACAQLCRDDALCLSFDIETATQTCYVSHTDRYAHPEAFLDFPTGIYYEWQGEVAAPEFEPNGGHFPTQIVVALLTSQLGATIHYRIVRIDDEDDDETSAANITAASLIHSADVRTATTGDVIVLPPVTCWIYAVAVKDGMDDSAVVMSDAYEIYAPKYIFLTPSFNGEYHGRVARVQIDIRGKKRPRPARYLEFGNYETPLGIGPYASQVAVIDLAAIDAAFKGLTGSVTALAPTPYLNESFIVRQVDPDDPTHTIEIERWHLVLEEQYTPHVDRVGVQGDELPPRVIVDAEYLYLTPGFNGSSYSSCVLRVLTDSFATATPVVHTLDLAPLSPDLHGFSTVFADAEFVYVTTERNADGTLTGKLVRIALDDFSLKGTSVLHLDQVDPRFVGFRAAFIYQGFAHLLPFHRARHDDETTATWREFPIYTSGLLIRVDLATFSFTAALDLALVHPHLVGFSGAVLVAHFALLVPYQRVDATASSARELNPFSGMLVRVDLRRFDQSGVTWLDLTQRDPDLRGFVGGFSYKQFVFLVPHRARYYTPGVPAQSGKLVRVDATNLTLAQIHVLDLPLANRSQVPDRPDAALRGFRGGVVAGQYGFLAPYFDGASFSGKICRVQVDAFEHVQTLDLAQMDDRLRGFAGAAVSFQSESLEVDLFNDVAINAGTTTAYEYAY